MKNTKKKEQQSKLHNFAGVSGSLVTQREHLINGNTTAKEAKAPGKLIKSSNSVTRKIHNYLTL